MRWNLRMVAAEHGMWMASDLRRMLAEQGLLISTGKMSNLWSGNPISIRLDDECTPADLLLPAPTGGTRGTAATGPPSGPGRVRHLDELTWQQVRDRQDEHRDQMARHCQPTLAADWQVRLRHRHRVHTQYFGAVPVPVSPAARGPTDGGGRVQRRRPLVVSGMFRLDPSTAAPYCTKPFVIDTEHSCMVTASA